MQNQDITDAHRPPPSPNEEENGMGIVPSSPRTTSRPTLLGVGLFLFVNILSNYYFTDRTIRANSPIEYSPIFIEVVFKQHIPVPH